MLRLTLALALLAGCSGSSDAPPTTSTQTAKKDPAAAKQLIASGAVVIDVRSSEEFAGGHLPGAVNIPVDELGRRLDEVGKLAAGDLGKPVVVYCASGHRAGKAQQQLRAAGYTKVVNGGGFDDLK